MKHTLLTALFASALGAASTGAQSPADTLQLNTVEVVATAKAPIQLTPLNLTTVTAADIERSDEANVLPVLQNYVAGMMVTRRGVGGYGVADGAAGAVSIRGVGGGNKVLFMIDGQPQWAGVFGHALPDTYVASEVERVEVVSGPSSLLYGSNAMGGSVNLVTRRATTDGFSGTVRAAGGSFATQEYSLTMSWKQSGWRAYAAASYDRSDGHRPYSQYWIANQYASLQYDFSRSWTLGANCSLNESTTFNPGEETAPVVDGRVQMFRANASIYLNNRGAISSGALKLYWSGGHHRINDGHSPGAEPLPYLFRSDDHNFGATLFQNIRPWTGGNLSVGFDIKNWGGSTWYTIVADGSCEPEVDRDVTEVAGYAMIQQDLFAGRWLSLNAGVRLDHSSQFGLEAVPQAGFVVRPLRGSTVKFSFGKGYRCPNLCELYIPYYSITTETGTFTGPCNPDLKPEYLYSYEVELRQRLIGDRLNVGLALYFIDGKEMIELLQRTDGPGRLYQNSGAFINKGVEVDASWRIAPSWSLRASYAYLHTSRVIAYAPQTKLFAELRFHPGAFDIALDNTAVWGLYTSSTERERYSVMNLHASYRFRPFAGITPRLFLKIENLTDASYSIVDGYPMPGITFLAGGQLTF